MTLDIEAIRKRNEAAGTVDVNLLLAEVERLRRQPVRAKQLEWVKLSPSYPGQGALLRAFFGDLPENWLAFEIHQNQYDWELRSWLPFRIRNEQYSFRSLEEAKAEAQRQLDAFVASIAETGEK